MESPDSLAGQFDKCPTCQSEQPVPTGAEHNTTHKETPQERTPQAVKPGKRPNVMKIWIGCASIITIIIVLIVIVRSIHKEPYNYLNADYTFVGADELKNLYKEYDTNKAVADARYRGKVISFELNVKTYAHGFLTLSDGDPKDERMEIGCYTPSNFIGMSGRKLIVTGVMNKFPILDDCMVIDPEYCDLDGKVKKH
jgi:hypothetical protein